MAVGEYALAFLGIANFLPFESIGMGPVECYQVDMDSRQVMQSLKKDIFMSSSAICPHLDWRQVSASQTSYPKPLVISSPSKTYAP
jgi:hypothetical protein